MKNVNDLGLKIQLFVKSNHKILLLLSILLTFTLIFGDINRTPFKADDFDYMNNFLTGEKINGIFDIVQSQFHHYFYWGGRIPVHFILQFLLFIGKPLASLFCAGAYTVVILIVCKVSNKENKIEMASFWFVSSLMYYFNPIWSETVTWFTGNANYLWGILLALLPILFFSKYGNKDKISLLSLVSFFILCMISGWTNENVGPLVFLFLLYSYFIKENRVKKWLLIGAVGCFLGCSLMILAPGNFIRSSVLINDFSGQTLKFFLFRAYNANQAIFKYLFSIIILSISLLLFEYKVNNKIERSGLFFTLGCLSIIAMIFASPYYPARATFGSMIFFLISSMMAINSVKLDKSFEFILVSFLMYFGFVMNVLPSLILTVFM